MFPILLNLVEVNVPKPHCCWLLDRMGCCSLQLNKNWLFEIRDRGIMRLCARIILRIIGDLPHNWANPV